MKDTTRHFFCDHLCMSEGCMKERDLFYSLGIGLGCTAHQLLLLTVEDLKDGYVSMPIGPLQIKRTYVLSPAEKATVTGRTGQLFTTIPEDIDTTDFLPLTMKRYYAETGDPAYPAHIMNMSEDEVLEMIG